jgi:hypothetical protein
MEGSGSEERKITYEGFSTSTKEPLQSETLKGLLDALESDKRDALVKIVIAEREVGTLRIENRKIYLNEVVDETPPEIEVLNKYPVYDKIAMKSLMEKYVDTIAEDAIEDISFLDSIRKNPEKRKTDDQHFILLLWDRYWNVYSRFKGDSKDGIYVISERNIWEEGDKNTFSSQG